jgi:E3 ubiquitin-protein ligase BAH
LTDAAGNLDHDLGRYMRKYFAKEVKEKARSDDVERGMEEYGPTYNHKECILM